MLVMLFFSGMNAPNRKTLFGKRLKNNLPESFEMASTNIYTDCKPYSCINSMGKWV
ncbi:MAG: hypothetical protein WBI57_02205 [Desulfobacterales bacterium]